MIARKWHFYAMGFLLMHMVYTTTFEVNDNCSDLLAWNFYTYRISQWMDHGHGLGKKSVSSTEGIVIPQIWLRKSTVYKVLKQQQTRVSCSETLTSSRHLIGGFLKWLGTSSLTWYFPLSLYLAILYLIDYNDDDKYDPFSIWWDRGGCYTLNMSRRPCMAWHSLNTRDLTIYNLF